MVQSLNRLVDVVQTVIQRLAHPTKLGYGEDHLVQADIAVTISVKDMEGLFGFRLAASTQHFDNILEIQRLTTLNHVGHPDPPRQGFGRLGALQRLRDDRVRRRGVEHMFASEFLRNAANHLRNPISKPADIPASGLENPGAAFEQRVTRRCSGSEHGVTDRRVLLLELLTVHREHGARGIVQHGKEVDVAFGVFDPSVELLPVVIDRDEQDDCLLSQEDQTAHEEPEEDVFDRFLPGFRIRVVLVLLSGIVCHHLLSLETPDPFA